MLMRQLQEYKGIRLLRYLVKHFIDDDCLRSAAALTYTTLFAVVPLMTVTYAILAAIPSFQEVSASIQSFLFTHFVPTSSQAVQNYLASFSEQARQLTAIGVTFLFITAVLMIRNIEASFNEIWKAPRARKGLTSLIIYWALLSIGPILLAIGFGLSSYITSLPFISKAADIPGFTFVSLKILVLTLSTFAFFILYLFIPNCHVSKSNALIGGFLTAFFFETAKFAFSLYIKAFPSYQLIYGAFATVPIFLLWIYISWILVLAGAVCVALLDSQEYLDTEKEIASSILAFKVLHQVFDAYQKGQLIDSQTLTRNIPCATRTQWRDILTWMQHQNWILHDEKERWFPAQDLHQIPAWQFVQKMPWALPKNLQFYQQNYPEIHFLHLAQEIQTDNQAKLQMPLAQLLTH
ncbi:membrane protein [Allopseudospirillum japonicum]|uniref:UPF0761 membrane protein SAMN05421831_10120 n=1 Tax=Allopseudospirillum japonicum TaxID=64971 RepID=A0A1H6Q0C8_9GAMM|nr:YihY family inner membrane protein [Allopseudospirillum japonicum]SEI37308.1 membrane protein [Allopseudospirillum japonicum]